LAQLTIWFLFSSDSISWFEAKTAIIRDAVRAYLANPHIRLPDPSTA